jgi:hypothetical protein
VTAVVVGSSAWLGGSKKIAVFASVDRKQNWSELRPITAETVTNGKYGL